LLNAYGPTETAITATLFTVPTQSETATLSHRVPIGRVCGNRTAYVLDRGGALAPIGVPGELHIGGLLLAAGYLNCPALTAEKFVPALFSARSGQRLYKTGDIVRYLPNGDLEFLGRVDDQVKVHGFRIELGEVEANLRQHPALHQVAVIVTLQAGHGKQLVAYFSSNGYPAPTVNELRTFLKDRLPEYTIPATFVALDRLPMTASGKIDRRALPAPVVEANARGGFVAPQTLVAKTLAEIWSAVLNVERIGLHDNFFELGGDSILSLQIVARARQAMLHLTPKDIFQHQTIAELAPVVSQATVQPVEQGPVTGQVPPTPIQCWFFERNLANPHHYNQAMLLQASQPIDPQLLQEAIRALLNHHDALRLRFQFQNDTWQQVNCGPIATAPFTWVDLSALSVAEQAMTFTTHAAKLQASLNLTNGPIVRFALFDFGPQRASRLLAIVHHLAVDGVSWRILLQDLQMAYRQLASGQAVRLPAKTTSFKQWATRLQAHAQTVAARASLGYWQRQTSDFFLPVDLTGRPNTQASAQIISTTLDDDETQALLQKVPATYHTQINDVLLTALAQAFQQWTGQNTLYLDLEGHGRESLFPDVDLTRTIGWFTTLFPVVLRLSETNDLGEAIKAIKEQLHHIPDRGLSYGLLHHLTSPSPLANDRKLAPISFNYLGQFDQASTDTPLFQRIIGDTGPEFSPDGLRPHLLEIIASVHRGQLLVRWRYSVNVHRRATIEKLAHTFVNALQTLIAHCQSPDVGGYTPSDFPEAELGQVELDELVSELNELMVS
jgi:non-ribosomal peptide synthase protein (TIGR01720 family)